MWTEKNDRWTSTDRPTDRPTDVSSCSQLRSCLIDSSHASFLRIPDYTADGGLTNMMLHGDRSSGWPGPARPGRREYQSRIQLDTPTWVRRACRAVPSPIRLRRHVFRPTHTVFINLSPGIVVVVDVVVWIRPASYTVPPTLLSGGRVYTVRDSSPFGRRAPRLINIHYQ